MSQNQFSTSHENWSKFFIFIVTHGGRITMFQCNQSRFLLPLVCDISICIKGIPHIKKMFATNSPSHVTVHR